MTQPGAVAAPLSIGESPLAKLDRVGSYIFAAFILGGGMFVPLGLAIYSLFFRG